MLKILAALLLFPSLAFAQAGPADPAFIQVLQNRDEFGRVIFMFGDSIMRGAALGFFKDRATEEQSHNPCIDNHSPAATVRNFGRTAVYAGAVGQPSSASSAVLRYRKLLAQKIIRPGDVIVMEDAGRHDGDPARYLENWLKIGHVFDDAGVTLVMMTIPDDIKLDVLGGEPADLYRFSVPFNGMSHNDATVAAAAALGAVLIDYQKIVRLRDDGIHPDISGQTILVTQIMSAIGDPLPQDAVSRVVACAAGSEGAGTVGQ